MKHYLSGIVIALSLALVLVLGVVALAENEPQAPELPAAGDLQAPAEAPEAAPATDDNAQAAQDNTALQEALDAYRAAKDSTREQALQDELDPRVFLLKLMPGTAPEIFDWVVASGMKGLVLEAFGMGGLHYIRRNLVDKLKMLSENGVYTIVTTQCMYEKADFSIYEVGRSVLAPGSVFSGRDMTSEAAVAKLMWVLGDPEDRLPLLARSVRGEMRDD